MKKRPILICTDPGVDDFIALCMLLKDPAFTVCGIVCLSGNVGLDITVNNALVCKELLSRPEIPVLVGSRKPLCRPERNAANIHGKSGLGESVEIYSALQPEKTDAADFIVQMAAQYEGTLELLSLGPLTDIALALQKHPECGKKFRSVTVMGGGIAGGNATEFAEFNILTDPEAAAVVFSCGVPITMVGLDATERCIFPRTAIPEIPENASTLGTIIPKMLHDYADNYQRIYGMDGEIIHDAVCALILTHPEWFRTKSYDVEICLEDGAHLGQTIVKKEGGLCTAAMDADSAQINRWMREFLTALVQEPS